MNLKDEHHQEGKDKPKELDKPSISEFKPKTNDELNEENPTRKKENKPRKNNSTTLYMV